METIIFTCTITGSTLRWEPSDVDRFGVRTTFYNLNEPQMPQPGYTVTLTAFTDTTITSTLSRMAENRITVSCVDPLPTLTTIGSTTISLAGELAIPITSVCYVSHMQIHQDHLPSCLTQPRTVQLMQLV